MTEIIQTLIYGVTAVFTIVTAIPTIVGVISNKPELNEFAEFSLGSSMLGLDWSGVI